MERMPITRQKFAKVGNPESLIQNVGAGKVKEASIWPQYIYFHGVRCLPLTLIKSFKDQLEDSETQTLNGTIDQVIVDMKLTEINLHKLMIPVGIKI